MRPTFPLVLLIACGLVSPLHAQVQPDHSQSPLVRIADNVIGFIDPDPAGEWAISNSYAILTSAGTFVIDTQVAPVLTEAAINSIVQVSHLPISYLLNTHWHLDHNWGNRVYRSHFPDIRIIAHARTRAAMMRHCPEYLAMVKNGDYAKYRESARKLLADNKDASGKPLSDSDRRRSERLVAAMDKQLPSMQLIECDYPDLTFDHNLTLHLAETEIQIRHTSSANTPGDAFVWLPQQRILFTGDILVYPIPYCFGSYFEEWVQVLDTMLALKPALILPGHGEVMRDTTYLRTVRDLFASLVEQAKVGVANGITNADSLGSFINLEPFRARLAGDDPDRNWAWRNYVIAPAMGRIIKELRGTLGDDTAEN